MELARKAINLVLAQECTNRFIAVVLGDKSLDLRFRQVAELEVDLIGHWQLSLIERGPIVIGFLGLAHVSGHEIPM